MSGKLPKKPPDKLMAGAELFADERLAWMRDSHIRPYVFVRAENQVQNAGSLHSSLDWFPHKRIYKNPLQMDQLTFANRILRLESLAFAASGLQMPRWVFYDCAIVPGFVAGFAIRKDRLSAKAQALLCQAEDDPNEEWVPLSLFIIIPTMASGGQEWVAHNLCSVNSLLPKEEGYYGIGFLSKAFGLWYANVRTCCGITQWGSPAIRLHSHYGDFEVLTAYTPVHSYARTLTYRLEVDPQSWPQFFQKRERRDFGHLYQSSGIEVDPKSEASLISLQKRLEKSEGPFYIDGQETMSRALDEPLNLYRKK